MPQPTPEASLTDLLEEGDLRAAAERLFADHAAEVLGVCHAILRDPPAAEDVSQEVFSRAFAGLRGYRGDAAPRTWILAIARNACFDHLRRAKSAPPMADDGFVDDGFADDAPLPPDLLAERDEVSRALAALDEHDRSLVMLRFCHGFDYAEIAEVFGIKPGTARMRVSRALARMRAELAPMRDAARSLDALAMMEAPAPDAIRRGARDSDIERRVESIPRPAAAPPPEEAFTPERAASGVFARLLADCAPVLSTQSLRERLAPALDRM